MLLLERGKISILPIPYIENRGWINYRFVFTHNLNRSVVEAIIPHAATVGERLDFFHIDVNHFFGAADDGDYTYEMYSHSSINPHNNNYLVSRGLARVVGEKSGPIQYQGTPTKFITYDGK